MAKTMDDVLAQARQEPGEWEVVTTPGTVVVAARMPAAWTDELAAEAQRRGLKNPSELIRALVREGLDRAQDVPEREPTDELRDLLGRANQLVQRLPRAA